MTQINFRFIFLAALFSVIISPFLIKITTRVGLVDRPNAEPHKKHLQNVPLAGGIVIALALLVTSAIGGLLEYQEITAILAAGSVVLVFGLSDDFRPLSPAWKLLGQVIGAILLIVLGVQVKIFLWNPINWVITLVWVVGLTNAFNFVDSMDGLASGLAGVASGLFMLVSFDSGQTHLSSFSAVLVGVCVGVYFYSALPAKYFLGDSGAQYLGFLLSGLSIVYNPLGFMPSQSWFIPIMLLAVPIFDAVLVVISRLHLKKPIYHSGLDHTYHRLVLMGMHPNRSVLTMHIVAVLLGCLAFISLSLPPIWANSVFVCVLVVGLISLIYLEKWNSQI